jgi:hypothetical protein
MSTITVRDAKIEDAARILEIYAYYVEYTVISFEWDVPSLEEFENRMRDIMKKISIPRHRAGWKNRRLCIRTCLCRPRRIRLVERADHLSRSQCKKRRPWPETV